MTSFNSTTDGLGFEEIGQPGSQPVNIWVTGSIQAEDNIITHKNFSATGSLYAADSVTTNVSATTISGTNIRVNNEGLVHSVSIQNATDIYGYKVKAGSVITGDGASGLIVFAGSFTNPEWFITITPRTLTNPYLYQVTDGSGLVPCVSGARRASGCWVYGGSATVYDWIAVGI